MINEISKEVEAKIPEYVEKYRGYGLKTGNVDKEKATSAAREFATYLEMDSTNLKVTFVDSPDAAYRYLKEGNPELSVSNFVNGCNWGNIYAYWTSLYSFIENELPVEKTGLIGMLDNIIQNLPPFWIDEENNEFIVSNFPQKVTFDNNERLHNEDGAAIEYTDGFNVYSLHGVRVPEWIVETPKDEIDPEKVLAITNVEIRLAAIRHVGLHNFLSQIEHKVLDKKSMEGDRLSIIQGIVEETLGQEEYNTFMINNSGIFDHYYELLLVRIEDRMCEFLKMVNPSTGEIHMEGVAPGTKTVNQALAFRLGLTEKEYHKPAFEA